MLSLHDGSTNSNVQIIAWIVSCPGPKIRLSIIRIIISLAERQVYFHSKRLGLSALDETIDRAISFEPSPEHFFGHATFLLSVASHD
jgi:hypothetical protein